MKWKEITIKVNKMAQEAITNIIKELGAQGVVLEENHSNQNTTNIITYYPANKNFSEFYSTLQSRIDNLNKYNIDTAEVEYKIQEKDEKEWSTSWHKYFHAINIGDNFTVCPDWENNQDDKRYIIKIKPGRAFGIGGHESTSLALENLEYILDKYFDNYKNVNMLDIGTGTGILSIAAAKMGLEDIISFDKEEAAVEAARINLKLNEVNDIIKIKKCDLKNGLDNKPKFNIVIANLLPDLIIDFLPEMNQYLKKEGYLILSGIIEKKRSRIVSLSNKLNLNVIKEKKENNWISLVLKRG